MKQADTISVYKFNSLALPEKWDFIKQYLNGRPHTAVNHLIFADKLIYFQCALLNLDCCIEAKAEPLPEMFKNKIAATIEEYGVFNSMLYTHEQDTAVKKYFFKATERFFNRNN